jgi:hypothetical protein
VDHARQHSDRQLPPRLQPWLKLGPGPSVHADLASLPAFATADKDRTATRVKIALLNRERFADPQRGAPQQDDQRAEPSTLSAISDHPHHFDDLLDGRRAGW